MKWLRLIKLVKAARHRGSRDAWLLKQAREVLTYLPAGHGITPEQVVGVIEATYEWVRAKGKPKR